MNRCLTFVASVVTLFAAAPAGAEPVLRPSVHGAFHAYDGDLAGGGLAIATAGYSLELDPILLVPEIAASIGGFGGDFEGYGIRALGGLRAGFAYLGKLEPSLFLRGGYGHLALDRDPFDAAPYRPVPQHESIHSGALQVGVSLEHRVDRDLTLGGELIYDALFYDRRPAFFGPTSREGGLVVAHSVSAGFTVAFWL